MKLLITFFSFCFLHGFGLQAQDLKNLKYEVEMIIEFDYNLDLQEGEGLWVGVIDGDSTFVFKLGNIEEDSLAEFQLGSLSKIFSYRMIEKLFVEHEISSDTKITDYIELNDSYQNISFQNLLDHQSKLPKEPYFFGKRSTNPDNPYEEYPNSLIVPELNKYSNLYAPAKKNEFAYGHLNYALVGLAIESISDDNYCNLIDTKYSNKYPSIKCSDRSTNLTLGFDKSGSSVLPWKFPGFEASEGLSSNIIDLTDFIRTELKEGNGSSNDIKISKHLSHQAPWYILHSKRSQKTYSFSGTTSSHSVFVCFDKNSKSAVVMMRNSGKGILHLPLSILDMVKSSKAKSK